MQPDICQKIDANARTTATLQDPTVVRYFDELRDALAKETSFDPATLNLFKTEIEIHFFALCTDLERQGLPQNEIANRAISGMASPKDLAQEAQRSDRTAFQTAPVSWWRAHLRTLAEYYRLSSATFRAVFVALLAIPTAYLLLLAVPVSLQTFWIVPLNAFAVSLFVFLLCQSSHLSLIERLNRRALIWSSVIAIGGTGATYLTEFVASYAIPFQAAISYGVMSLSIAGTVTLAFWAAHLQSVRSSQEQLVHYFLSLSAIYWFIALGVRLTLGRHHETVFFLFVVFAGLTVNVFEKYLTARRVAGINE